jgi:hypothetical protein
MKMSDLVPRVQSARHRRDAMSLIAASWGAQQFFDRLSSGGRTAGLRERLGDAFGAGTLGYRSVDSGAEAFGVEAFVV